MPSALLTCYCSFCQPGLWLLPQQLQSWRDALLSCPFIPSFFPKRKFSCRHHTSFSVVHAGAQHSFNFPTTFSPALSPPPTPWLSVGPIYSAELFGPHDAERGFNKYLKSFCWSLLFFTCISAFSATVTFSFTCYAWKQLSLLEFLIFLFNHIDFRTLLTPSEEFRYSWITDKCDSHTERDWHKLSQIRGDLKAKHKCLLIFCSAFPLLPAPPPAPHAKKKRKKMFFFPEIVVYKYGVLASTRSGLRRKCWSQ